MISSEDLERLDPIVKEELEQLDQQVVNNLISRNPSQRRKITEQSKLTTKASELITQEINV